MAILFQPTSRTLGQREGCVTPQNYHEDVRSDEVGRFSNLANAPSFTQKLLSGGTDAASSNHEILSPPMSPYRKESLVQERVSTSQKSYINTVLPLKIKDYRSYSLMLCPWKLGSSDYKNRLMSYLGEYSTTGSSTNLYSLYKLSDRRADRDRGDRYRSEKSKKRQSSGSDSESESLERVRTRRFVKESSLPLSKIERDSSEVSSLPVKRKKVRKELFYAGSPLAAQKAALIDENIPDYSPNAFETLPKGYTRCLKIEWKGQPMDLRDDPDADKLHPAEIILASTLRLPCNVYLDSKRRLISEKVSRLRNEMPFRRTDAQKACRIDVNKASRLFAAFEKVGWLNDEHFTKYL